MGAVPGDLQPRHGAGQGNLGAVEIYVRACHLLQAFLSSLAGALRAVHINFLGAFGSRRENCYAIFQHLRITAAHRQVVGYAFVDKSQITWGQFSDQRSVTR